MQDNICFDFFYIYLVFCFCFFNASIPLKNITHSNPQLFIKLKKDRIQKPHISSFEQLTRTEKTSATILMGHAGQKQVNMVSQR